MLPLAAIRQATRLGPVTQPAITYRVRHAVYCCTCAEQTIIHKTPASNSQTHQDSTNNSLADHVSCTPTTRLAVRRDPPTHVGLHLDLQGCDDVVLLLSNAAQKVKNMFHP